jgi:hypothetical protein
VVRHRQNRAPTQAGYTANYQFGTITLNGAQLQAWTNIATAQAACSLLANGGIPASINGSSSTPLCTSFSSTANFPQQVNLASAAGLTTDQALTAATGSGYTTATVGSGSGA